MNFSSPLSLNQAASDVDISYASILLFKAILSPGEVQYYSFRKLSPHYTGSALLAGYVFFDQPPTQVPSTISDITQTLSLDLSGKIKLQWDSDIGDLLICDEG